MTLCTLIISAYYSHYDDACTQGSVVLCTHRKTDSSKFCVANINFFFDLDNCSHDFVGDCLASYVFLTARSQTKLMCML